MEETIRITGTDGRIRFEIRPRGMHARAGRWSDILADLSNASGTGLSGLNLREIIRETVSLTNANLEGSDLSLDEMARSSFIDCNFTRCTMTPVNFHHPADRTDHISRSVGTLFLRCDFSQAKLTGCNFVMSKFIDCTFDGASFTHCDFRNVTWFDRLRYRAETWDEIPELPDPFISARLQQCRFGHPMSNAMSLPVHMMIPRSYNSVWSHMGEVAKRVTRFAYLMSSEPEGIFESAI